jgi:hypothetical protein
MQKDSVLWEKDTYLYPYQTLQHIMNLLKMSNGLSHMSTESVGLSHIYIGKVLEQ